MTPTGYVSANAAFFAREFEQRFQKLPAKAGIIFVSVDAVPAPEGKTTSFHIRLGITKNLTEDVGWALIQTVLRDEIKNGVAKITASVFVGFSGACSDKSLEGSDSSSPKAYDTV